MSVKTIAFKAMFESAKELNIGDFIKFYHTKIVDWKRNSPNLGKRGIDETVDSVYAIIGISQWGDYTTVYVGNDCFVDAQNLPGQDNYNGSLIWEYNWYIQDVENKAIPITVKNQLPLPIGPELRNPKTIAIETFEDILLNYKINDNFLAFHNAD